MIPCCADCTHFEPPIMPAPMRAIFARAIVFSVGLSRMALFEAVYGWGGKALAAV
jgi:hypothetical protein